MSKASKEDVPSIRKNIFSGVKWNTILGALKITVLVIYYYFEAFILMLRGGQKNVAGKIVLITGSANGLGREIALNFACLGAILVLWDINEEANKNTSELAKRNGALEVYTYTCDLSKREEIYATADQVKKDVGDVDIVINNAGVLKGKNFIELSDADLEKTVELNISANFWTCKAFLPAMIENNSGHLVTISSASALTGVNKMSVYCASKAAEIGFLESIAFEMWAAGKKGIKTTIICPSFVDTELITGVRSKSFFVPVLKRDYVGQKIVDAILKEKFYLFVPAFLGVMSPKTLLPRKALFLIVEYLGFFTYMEQFIGHTGMEKN